MKKQKKAQEEMVGFVLIVIVVAVILLFFLTFSLQDQDTSIESHEAESFISSALEYTTDCKTKTSYLDVRGLMFECFDDPESVCVNDCDEDDEECIPRKTCDVLNSTLKDVVQESWPVGPTIPNKGYEFEIMSNEKKLVFFSGGEVTSTYKGALQNFARGQNQVDITLRIYS